MRGLNQIIAEGYVAEVHAFTNGNYYFSSAEWKETEKDVYTTLVLNDKTKDYEASFIQVRFNKEYFRLFFEKCPMKTIYKIRVIGRIEAEVSRGTGIITNYIYAEHVELR